MTSTTYRVQIQGILKAAGGALKYANESVFSDDTMAAMAFIADLNRLGQELTINLKNQ